MQEHYYDEYLVVEDQHWWFRARRTILRASLERADLWRREHTVVDVGSGTGRMLDFLAAGMRVVGVDLDPAAVRFASARQTSPVVQASAAALPFRTEAVDVVTAFDIIEHLPDEGPTLKEMHRVLKPGGHLVVTVPALASLWSEHDELNQHQRRYRRRELSATIAGAGFRLVRASYFNTLLFPPIAAVRYARRLLGERATRKDDQGRLKSDFSMFPSPMVARLCETIFASEAALLRHLDLPLGVSLLAIAQKPVSADG